MVWACNSAHSQNLNLCHFILLIYTKQIAAAKRPKIQIFMFTRLWLTSSVAHLLQVFPVLPSEEGSPQRPSPLGHHENTVSKNRDLLPSFQLFCSSRYLSLPFALLDGGHAHRSSTHSCTEMICTMRQSAVDGFRQVLQGDCVADW